MWTILVYIWSNFPTKISFFVNFPTPIGHVGAVFSLHCNIYPKLVLIYTFFSIRYLYLTCILQKCLVVKPIFGIFQFTYRSWNNLKQYNTTTSIIRHNILPTAPSLLPLCDYIISGWTLKIKELLKYRRERNIIVFETKGEIILKIKFYNILLY